MSKGALVRKAIVSDLSILQQMSAELIDSDNFFDNNHLLREWSLGEDGKKYLLRRIRGKKGVCFVAEIQGDIVGYLTGGESSTQKWRPFPRAEIDNIYVKQAYRGNKIGSDLMDAFIHWAKLRGIEKVFLYTMADNQKAIRFYEKNQFFKFNLVLEKDI
jgi:ribosomal protein S18 acetylase RimI-like enzyme